jgi:hypothetical protein
MNQSAIRLFVRSLITEAKEEKAAKLPKSSGKLMDLKKELAALEQMKEEIQTAKFAEKTASTEVEFANLSKFAKELDKIKAGGVALEASIDAKIEEIKGKIDTQKSKIKEMIGMTPTPGQEPMVDEKKEKPAMDATKKAKAGDNKPKADKSPAKKTAKLKEELNTNTSYSGAGQNTGNSGSSLEFKITEKGADGVTIKYTITPNSKQRQAGAGDKSARVTKKGYTTIKKSDVVDSYIKIEGENFRLDQNFLDQL